MNTALNRTQVVFLTNKSGSHLNQGDVGIIDIANASSFTTTTTPGYSDGMIVVVIDTGGIDDDAAGMVAIGGYVPKINLGSSASVGDLISTSSVAGEGSVNTPPFIEGNFGSVLGSGTSPAAIIFSNPIQYVPSVFPIRYILLQDVKTAGTDGGTFTSGGWVTRDLNTEVVDSGGDCSLSANQFTLLAGTYEYRISCPGFRCDNHKAVLYNVTDAVIQAYGTSEVSGTTDSVPTRSLVVGKMTIATSKVFEVQHQAYATQSGNGLGVNANFGDEIFTVVELWRTA